MIGMDYFYADQQAQSPCDEENATAICRLVDAGYVNAILMSQQGDRISKLRQQF